MFSEEIGLKCLISVQKLDLLKCTHRFKTKFVRQIPISAR